MPQHVPSPACWLLRGDWKHLFIVLCIIDHSEILITSFPQGSSEMVCLIIIGDYPVLRTLDSYLSTLSDFPRPPFHCSFPSTCFGQGQCYRRRKAIGHAYMTSVMKIPLLIITIYGPDTLNLKYVSTKDLYFLSGSRIQIFFHTSLERKVTTILTYSH